MMYMYYAPNTKNNSKSCLHCFGSSMCHKELVSRQKKKKKTLIFKLQCHNVQIYTLLCHLLESLIFHLTVTCAVVEWESPGEFYHLFPHIYVMYVHWCWLTDLCEFWFLWNVLSVSSSTHSKTSLCHFANMLCSVLHISKGKVRILKL